MPDLTYEPFGVTTLRNPTTGDVVQWMCKFAWEAHKDLEIRHLAEAICREVQSGDYVSEVKALLKWFDDNTRYVKDMDRVETVRWPREVLATRTGDCDCLSMTLAALAMSIGHRCDFALASFHPLGIPSHVFVRVQTPWGGMACDPVAKWDTEKMLSEMTSVTFVDVGQGIEGVDGMPWQFHGWSGWRP